MVQHVGQESKKSSLLIFRDAVTSKSSIMRDFFLPFFPIPASLIPGSATPESFISAPLIPGSLIPGSRIPASLILFCGLNISCHISLNER